jgi:peptidoglycan/LPS O-acetylase OafA/YrhL
MEQLVQEQKKSNILLQFGLISALVSLLVFVLMYIGGTEVIGSPFAILTWFIPVIVAVFALKKAKKENDGFLEFREALKISFGVLVFSTLATSIFSYLLYHYIDPPFGERMVQLTIEKSQQFMEKLGTPQDAIDKAVKEMTFDNLFSFKKVFQGFMFGCIFNFIIALIIAAIMKKKKPEFAA